MEGVISFHVPVISSIPQQTIAKTYGQTAEQQFAALVSTAPATKHIGIEMQRQRVMQKVRGRGQRLLRSFIATLPHAAATTPTHHLLHHRRLGGRPIYFCEAIYLFG